MQKRTAPLSLLVLKAVLLHRTAWRCPKWRRCVPHSAAAFAAAFPQVYPLQMLKRKINAFKLDRLEQERNRPPRLVCVGVIA
jgi:hypothetical protein